MLILLKRVLPFTLTLAVGSAVGGFFNLFGSSQDTRPAYAPPTRTEFVYTSPRSSCRKDFERKVAATIRSAEIYYQPKPVYTEAARRNRTEGDVTLRITLGANGTVQNVEAITSLPNGLTEQAKQAAREIRFTPALRAGSPVDEVKTITYSFDLD